MSSLDRNNLTCLEGIASYGCVFLELKPGTKMPTRPWDRFEEMHEQRGESRLDLALGWLKKGSGVGYLPRNRLAVIDCDDMETVRRVIRYGQEHDLLFPQIRTPSGGRHFLFHLAEGIDYTRLKHHICHPKEHGVVVPWDFKLGIRTMLVAPGTVKAGPGGGALGKYQGSLWLQPPKLDPRALAPNLRIYRDTTPCLRDFRPERERVMGAMSYLRSKAPVCRGAGARKVLLEVARHLVSWYQLDPHYALHLMTVDKRKGDGSGSHVSWNHRCVDEQGSDYPWLEHELLEALTAAVDEPSVFGRWEFKRVQEREAMRWHLPDLFHLLNTTPVVGVGDRISTEELFQRFLEMTNLDRRFITVDEFGAEVNQAITAGRISTLKRHRTSKRKGFEGVDQPGRECFIRTLTGEAAA